jgi:hypothetical protein
VSPILGIWASSRAVAAGDYESIATVTVGSGGTSTVSFTSIPNTYTHLQIRATAQASASDIFMRFNSDTTTSYAKHYLYGNGSTATANGYNNQDLISFAYTTASGSVFSGNVCDILDYANTNKNKTVRVLNGWDSNGSGGIILWSGAWFKTDAITSISIFPPSSVIAQYSHFALYGIKSA